MNRKERMDAALKQEWSKLRVMDLSALQSVSDELARARAKHPEFPTIHHGISVIREEYLEVEEAAFVDGVEREPYLYEHMRREAIQLAATCIRLLTEL